MGTCRPARNSRASSTADLVSIREPCSGRPNRIRLLCLWRSKDEDLFWDMDLELAVSCKGGEAGEAVAGELGGTLSEAVESSATLDWRVKILVVSDWTEEPNCSLSELRFVKTSLKESEFWLTNSEIGSRLRDGSLSISLASQKHFRKRSSSVKSLKGSLNIFKIFDCTTPALRHKPRLVKCLLTLNPKLSLSLFYNREVETIRDDLLEALIIAFEMVGLNKGKYRVNYHRLKL